MEARYVVGISPLIDSRCCLSLFLKVYSPYCLCGCFFFLSGFHMPIWNIFPQVRVRRMGKCFPVLFGKIRRTTHLTIAELSVCYIQFTHRSLCGM